MLKDKICVEQGDEVQNSNVSCKLKFFDKDICT